MSLEVLSWPELQKILLDVARGPGWHEAGHLEVLGCCQRGPGSLRGLKGHDTELPGPLPVFRARQRSLLPAPGVTLGGGGITTCLSGS